MGLFGNCGCHRPTCNCGCCTEVEKECQCVTTCETQCQCNNMESCSCNKADTESVQTISPVCTCNCTCTCTPGASGGNVSPAPTPVPVRAMLHTVLDSCCTTENITKEFTFNLPELFDPCELEVGSIIPVELDGDIVYKEVDRDKDDCLCLSTVRFHIPIRLFKDDCCCSRRHSVCKTITVIRSAALCCTRDSVIYTPNTRVLAISAVVTDICGCEVTIAVNLLFRSCIQQTIWREFSFDATPVCEQPDCLSFRNLNVDPCDMICGCTEAAKKCPSC